MRRSQSTWSNSTVSFLVATWMAVVCVEPAAAHDSWLVAGANTANAGETIRLAVVTAEVFPVSEHAAEPNRIKEWAVIHAGDKREVSSFAIEGMELAARFEMDQPGMHVIAVALRPRYIEIESADFNAYLEDEHAEAALAARHANTEQEKPGRELYTKLAKTFVEVADDSKDTTYRQPVGHPLEIIPLSNPCRWNVGDEVLVRVLRNGQPAADLRVSCGHEGLPPHTYVQNVITDDDGVARIRLARPGLWFVRTHTINAIERPGATVEVDASTGERAVADWESFWASITFRVAGGE